MSRPDNLNEGEANGFELAPGVRVGPRSEDRAMLNVIMFDARR